jgi:hypothetical protein
MLERIYIQVYGTTYRLGQLRLPYICSIVLLLNYIGKRNYVHKVRTGIPHAALEFGWNKMRAQIYHSVDTQNWHNLGFLNDLDRPVRPLVQTGQTGQEKFVKSLIRLHHCVDLVETIEMHI